MWQPFRNALARNTQFVGNVAVMMSGKTIAALIALVTVPIVARLFVPDDFGVAAIFASITGMIATVSSLRYSAAIVLPEDDGEADQLMSLSYRIMFIVCALILAGIAVCNVLDVPIAPLQPLGKWSWLLPLSIALMSALHIQESWLTRQKSFKTFSASLIAGNASTSVSRIGFGATAGSSVLGLVLGYFIGIGCRLAVQHTAFRQGLRVAFSNLNWDTTKLLARRYSDFPIFNTPAGLVFSMGQNLPVLLFGMMFSPAVAGLYAMADRLSQVPITIVAASVRRVFLQKAAEVKNRHGNLGRAFALTSGTLALVGLLPFAAVAFYGQEVSVWLLGERWIEAGRFLEIVAPWLFMVWVAAPCNGVFVVLRKQKFWLSLTTALTALRLGAFGVAYLISADPELTLACFVAASIIGNVFTFVTTLYLIRKHKQSASGESHP